MNKDFTMAPAITYSRRTLSAMMGLDDRAMRAQVRKQRRAGVPIMAVSQRRIRRSGSFCTCTASVHWTS